MRGAKPFFGGVRKSLQQPLRLYRWRLRSALRASALPLLWLLMTSLCPTPVRGQQLAFEAVTHAGERVQLRSEEHQATVVCFLGTECPMARGYASQLNQLQQQFAAAGVRIVGVMSNSQDSAEDIAGFVEQLQIEFTIVQDAGQAIADRYGANRTPEAFLLDRQLKLRYRGRIDDQLAPGVARAAATRQDLRIALEELLAGKPISISSTVALGCVIGRVKTAVAPSDSAHAVTYTNQVVRVLQKHCWECHRQGEIGPFAMDSFEEVLGWAETMLETVEQGRMPPWHADPSFGDFVNQRSMPEADKQVLRDWLASGLPRGDESDAPESPSWTAGWNLPRPPDLVVEMRQRPFEVPRDGVVEYQYFVADPGLKEDVWVTAAQVIPGARSVVHHAIVFVRPPDGADFRGAGWLAGYVPGQRTFALPPGRARRVPAGSKFVFQMHYTPSGVAQADVTKVGLITCPADQVSHEVMTLMAINQEFEIPPGASSFAVRADLSRIPAGSELLAISPHMHVRGKSFRLFDRRDPGQVLLYVPAYDFNWQHSYQLRNPLPLDQFSEGLECEVVFDNSSANPFNPNPSETVTWGDQTWEEMAVAFFEIARPLTSAQPQPVAREVGGPTDESSERAERIEKYVQRVFDELDSNRDGVIKKAEVAIVVRHMHFGLWDLNQDAVAERDEVRRVAERLYQ